MGDELPYLCEKKFVSSWMRHVLGFDEGVEFFGGDVAQFEGGFAEADAGVVGCFGDLGGLVVADVGGLGGDVHQGVLDLAIYQISDGFSADDVLLDAAD